MYKGSITVFMSLILGLLLSLVLTVVDSARYSAEKMRIEMAMNMGLVSTFAEYNRELLEKYDLAYIDSSYGNSVPSLKETSMHLKEYMDYELHPSRGLFFTGAGDLYGLNIKNASADLPSRATDDGGRVFKRQAIEAVKDMYGVGIAEDLHNHVKDYKGSGILKENLDERRAKIDKKLKDADIGSDTKKYKKTYDMREGIISRTIYGSYIKPSHKKLMLEGLASYRENIDGIGVVKPGYDTDSLTSNLLYTEYLSKKFRNYADAEEDGYYEQEYILNGKNTNIANLRCTVEKLFSMRAAANTMMIFRDSGKRAQAQAIAEPIAAAAAIAIKVDITEPLTDFFMVCWSTSEAVLDVRTLLSGGKVPLVKQSEDWRLQNILKVPFSGAMKGKTDGEGLDYSNYMKLLMVIENEVHPTVMTMRAIDMIELNLRETPGNGNFRMDGCIEFLEADAEITDCAGRKFTIRRSYSYMPVIE